jgi:hypothetical protein
MSRRSSLRRQVTYGQIDQPAHSLA